jgi:uncharacterized protein
MRIENMLKNLAEIEKTLKTKKLYLNERYRVKELGIFGSYLHGDQKPSSDVDILVEFDEPIGLFDYIRLENYLTQLLGIKVDLVMKDSLKPRLKDRVVKEAQYI